MKVFFVLVSFLVINFNLLGCSLGQQIAEPVIYLMPEGYMGNVYIFHDVPDGFPLKREDRARVYEIPKDGIFCKKNFYQKIGFCNWLIEIFFDRFVCNFFFD